jgi:hypothetical protein
MRGGGNVLNPENNASSNVVSPELKEWVPAEYEAAYAARFANASESLTATHCSCVGWEDANTELSESARQNRLVAEGREGELTETWFTLYDIGGDGRLNGIPFDEHRTEPWKLGWIDVDIKLGTIAGRKL